MKCGPGAISSVPPKGSGDDRSSSGGAGGEVYLEFVVVGEAVKVIAVDASSGTEVSIMGSIHASKAELERVAIDKLRYVQGIKADKDGSTSKLDRPVKDGGKGWVV